MTALSLAPGTNNSNGHGPRTSLGVGMGMGMGVGTRPRQHSRGVRLVISLCLLIVLVVFVQWWEHIEPLHLGDDATRTVGKSEFWRPFVQGDEREQEREIEASIITDDDQTMMKQIKTVADDDDNLFGLPSARNQNANQNTNQNQSKNRSQNRYRYRNRNQEKNILASFRNRQEKKTKKQRYEYSSEASWMRDHYNRKYDEQYQYNPQRNSGSKSKHGLRRHQQIASEKLQYFPVIQNTDDSIPMAVGGSVVQAADALLCRESVLDYVINATDGKDECDGLKKAYTQTCAADDGEQSQPQPQPQPQPQSDEQSETQSQTEMGAPQLPGMHRRRLHPTKNHGVLYWQHQLSRLSFQLRSWWWSEPEISMVENQILDVWEESKMEVLANDRSHRRRMLGDWGVDNNNNNNNNNDDYDYDDEEDDDGVYSHDETYSIKPFITTDQSHARAVHRRITDQTSEDKAKDDDDDDDEDDDPEGDGSGDKSNPSSVGIGLDEKQKQIQGQESKNGTQTTTTTASIKKPLANLALPVTSKHVSEKMLTETLMLQQDNKLMKAVAANANHTEHMVTEAQADAAVSSKAVADAADMISNVLNDPTSVEARTCCTSILNVFHENCNVDQEEELSDRRLLVGVAVIACCGLIKSLIRHFHLRWLPEAAGCIMVGVTAGYVSTFYPHHDISFDGNWFLRIMVPPIVFEAALSIDKRSFSRHIVPIMFYAVLGTLVATVVTAVVVSEGSKLLNCETIPYAESLAFGALISSIDPIAVLSVLSNMGMTDQDTIYVVIFGESLLNDGVAIVLFETIVHFLDDNMIVDGHAVTAATIHFLVVFLGSLLIGIGYGLCCTLYYWIMFGCQTPLVEVLMFCCWALVPYYVCDGIQWSGIVAVVAAGFIMDMHVVGAEKLTDMANDEADSEYEHDPDKVKERRRRAKVRRPIFSKEGLLSKEAKTHIAFVTEIIATMMETAIFAYLGLFLFSSRYHWNFNHVLISIFGCCLSRAIMIPSLSFVANWITKIQQSGAICRLHELPQQSHHPETPSHRPHQAAGVIIDSKMQLVLWFAGLRGAMSFALVEHIPQYDAVSGEGTRLKSELKAMTSACIIFTVFVLGGSTYYMMEALGLSPKPKSDGTAEQETEMIGLLSSVSSLDTDDRIDGIDEKERLIQENENSEEMISHKPLTNSHRRPGKPVRRQRNVAIN